MVPRNLYIIKYVARVYYYIIASVMYPYILYIPNISISTNITPFFCWQSERSERSERAKRQPPPTAVKKQYPRSGKLGFYQKIDFEPGDILPGVYELCMKILSRAYEHSMKSNRDKYDLL